MVDLTLTNDGVNLHKKVKRTATQIVNRFQQHFQKGGPLVANMMEFNQVIKIGGMDDSPEVVASNDMMLTVGGTGIAGSDTVTTIEIPTPTEKGAGGKKTGNGENSTKDEEGPADSVSHITTCSSRNSSEIREV